MVLARWDPWAEIATLQRDMSQLLGRTAGTPAATASRLVPALDAYRTDEALVVLVELPGMAPDQVDVSVDDGVLTLSGTRSTAGDVPDDAWLRRERAVGSFERSFSLPEGTDPAAIEASFSHGMLELRIPHPPQRRPHRVEIRDGESDQTVQVGSGG